MKHARFAAVGEATAAALAQAGYPPGIVGGGSGEALLSALPERLDGVRILWPCGEDASRSLAGALESRGASVVRSVVYRKVARPPEASLGVEILNRAFAAFCPTSPAAGRWLFQSAGVDGEEPLRATPGVVLGEATAAFLRASGVRRIAIAARPRFTEALALLEALACPPAGK